MNKMIKLKYVPCGINTLHRLVVSATNGEQPVLDMDWVSTGGGCPPIASLDEIKAIVVSTESQSGCDWTKTDVSRALSDNHIKKFEEANFVSLSNPEFSGKTKRNYLALLSNWVIISISQSSSQKTMARFAAEISLPASISNLALISSTRFIPVSSNDSNLLEEIYSLPEPTQMLLNWVSNAWGTSVFPVLPELIVSTDDMTEYIFEGFCEAHPKYAWL
jgi:hypothetical protein